MTKEQVIQQLSLDATYDEMARHGEILDIDEMYIDTEPEKPILTDSAQEIYDRWHLYYKEWINRINDEKE